eukprot:m51a1_g6971 hypothetical protein (218) ;mRNA; f:103746-104630
MGQLLSGGGGKGKKNKVTAHDKAVLDLKVQRDRLIQYQKKVGVVIWRELQIAKELNAAGKRSQALIALKKRKYQQKLLERSEQQLTTVQQMVDDVEFAQMEAQVFEGLRKGNEVLAALNKEMSVEQIEDLMAETQEAAAYQREIDQAMSGLLSPEDQADVDEELAALERSVAITAAPAAPTAEPVAAAAAAAAQPQEEEEQQQQGAQEQKRVAVAAS